MTKQDTVKKAKAPKAPKKKALKIVIPEPELKTPEPEPELKTPEPEPEPEDYPKLLISSICFTEPFWSLGRCRTWLKKQNMTPLKNCIRGTSTLNYILTKSEDFKEGTFKKVQISDNISILVGEEY